MRTSRRGATGTRARCVLPFERLPKRFTNRDLPRAHGQGTLSILIRNAPASQTSGPSEQEVYQRFAQFGEIKSVYPSEKRSDVKFIEFYDSRVRYLFRSLTRRQGC